MAKLSRNNQGFSALETILLLVVVGVIGFLGWFVWQMNHNKKSTDTTKPKALQTNKPAAADPYAGWKQYCSTEAGYCLKYPSNWTVSEEDSNMPGYKNAAITAPDGGIKVSYNPNLSGIGGGCPTNCYFTTTAITPIATAPTTNILQGVSSNDDTGGYYPLWTVISDKGIADYKLKVGEKTNVGFFIADFSHPTKNSSNVQTLSVRTTGDNTQKTMTDANAWFSDADVKTAAKILGSLTQQ